MFQAIAKAPYDDLAAPAMLHATRLQYEKREINAAKAADALNQLRYRWRGDGVEMEVIRALGKLYIDQGRYREALEALRSAGTRMTDRPQAAELQADLANAFRALFLEGGADGLQPVQALGLFYDFRFDADGNAIADFVLNKPEYKGASVLIAGDNFGCGSSREHAPWALMDYGIMCVISTSFADIFFNNCFKNGLLPVILPEEQVDILFKECEANEGYQLTVDLEKLQVIRPNGEAFSFSVDNFRRHCLLNGLDDIGLTLQAADDIRAFEAKARAARPWVFNALR